MSVPKPFYDEGGECMIKTCECGCGEAVAKNRRFITHHNFRIPQPFSSQHRARIGAAQKRAWDTTRKRTPLGSKNIDRHGYVRVKTHPSSGRWTPEHILVIEACIGRKTTPGEQVHHINGIRADNRPENLYLCRDHNHHQSIERSLTKVARELLNDGIIRFNTETGTYERTS